MDNARVVLEGAFCEQPPLGLIKTLENAGCYIVNDDFMLGHRWLLQDVQTEGDPISALATAFIEHSTYSSAKYEAGMPKGELLVEMVRKRDADGVIFACPSFCDPALLDRPEFEKSLDEAGIPHTSFQYAENLGQFQVIKEQTGTFSDSIKLWSTT
jgi:benzoyl-CoA reductase subunit C